MTTRTPFPGSATNTTLSAANLNNGPGGWCGIASVTSSQTGIGTSATDLTSLTLTYTFVANRYYKITGHIPAVVQNTSNGYIKIAVYVGGSIQALIFDETVYATERATVDGSVIIQPSAGSATYKLVGWTSANTFDMSASAAGSDPGPAYILIEDMGST